MMPLGSRLIAAYFFYLFHVRAGFPPVNDINSTSITYLSLSIFFFILPLAKKLKLGKLLEYEAQVKQVKEEVKEFKAETRELIAVYNNLINTVSNTINQNVTVNLPGREEIEQAKEDLDSTIKEPEAPSQIEKEISDFMVSEGLDVNFALAKLRMEMEKELREILGKRVSTTAPADSKIKFLTARSLFREFINKYPDYANMLGSYDYVLKVCNAAIHGQKMDNGHAQEALYMGFRILDELKRINKNEL